MKLRRVKSEDPWVYCSVDYGTLELCTLAQVNLWRQGFSRMAEAINADQDLHSRLGARIGGVPYDEFVKRVKAKDPWATNLRQLAKPINFGLPGGMGAAKLVLTARKDDVRFCELSGVSTDCNSNEKITRWADRPIPPTCAACLDLAVKYKKLWLAEWEEMDAYLKWAGELADREEVLTSFGNGMLRGGCNYNSTANHYFQNLAAQGAKHAGWVLAKETFTDRRSVLYNNARVVVFVHDENMSEIREGVAHECAFRKAEIMVAAMQQFVPDVKIKAVPALSRRWFKAMDASFDKSGRLKPWWPTDKACKWPEHAKADCGCWKYAPDQDLMAEDLAA